MTHNVILPHATHPINQPPVVTITRIPMTIVQIDVRLIVKSQLTSTDGRQSAASVADGGLSTVPSSPHMAIDPGVMTVID